MSKCGLKVCIKQGEELNYGFTIKEDGRPMSLYGYDILVKVKQAPYEDAESIIDKVITSTSDINDVGIIDAPEVGSFIIHFNKEDTKFPTGEYSLIIALKDEHYEDIISSGCCTDAKFIICEQ